MTNKSYLFSISLNVPRVCVGRLINKKENNMKDLKLNIHAVSGSSPKLHKCTGYWSHNSDGSEFDCGYDTIIDCDHCKYSVGKKDPEAKCNQNYR